MARRRPYEASASHHDPMEAKGGLDAGVPDGCWFVECVATISGDEPNDPEAISDFETFIVTLPDSNGDEALVIDLCKATTSHKQRIAWAQILTTEINGKPYSLEDMLLSEGRDYGMEHISHDCYYERED